MSLTPGVDSYVALAEADAHHAHRGRAEWEAATIPRREAALVTATIHLDASYRWVGALADAGQPLGWPRLAAFDHEDRPLAGIPLRVRQATAELALIALDHDLLPARLERGGRIRAESAGGVSISYAETAPGLPTYPAVDRLLSGLVRPSGTQAEVRRA